MKESINFCPFPGTESLLEGWPGGLAGFLRDHGLDGIELQVWDREPYADPFPETVGVHLRHWPFWMDFWLDDRDELARNHPDAASMQRWFMGAENREQWIEAIRANIAASLSYRPEYLVWHVTHCGLDESYHRRFRYSSEQIIDATVELFGMVSDAIPDGVTVLFENLWWNGLTLLEPRITDRLFSGIGRDGVGIMLDTGHLMNCRWDLHSEAEAVAFLLRTVADMGVHRSLVKGVHLSCSLSGEYQKSCLGLSQPGFDMMKIFSHIAQIDRHQPFTEAPLKALLDELAPRWLVHELFYTSLPELSGLLTKQKALMLR